MTRAKVERGTAPAAVPRSRRCSRLVSTTRHDHDIAREDGQRCAACVAPSTARGRDSAMGIVVDSSTNETQLSRLLFFHTARGTRNAIKEPDPSSRPRLWNFPFWLCRSSTDDVSERASFHDTDQRSQIHPVQAETNREMVACRLQDLDLWLDSEDAPMRHGTMRLPLLGRPWHLVG